MDSSLHSWCPLQYNEDIVVEVLKHLDSKSLAMAACVNRHWKRAAETESLWERICSKQWPPAAADSKKMRSVVIALGGYRRFFIVCLRPLLDRCQLPCKSRAWCDRDAEFIPLSLSLFSMDCYERLGRNKRYLRDDEPNFIAPVGLYTLEIWCCSLLFNPPLNFQLSSITSILVNNFFVSLPLPLLIVNQRS